MVIITENFDLLNDDDKVFLEKKCDDFKLSEPVWVDGDYINYFNREILDFSDSFVQNIVKKVVTYVNTTLNRDDIELTVCWINKVDTTSNKNDEFHKDRNSVTLMVYLNEDFDGGELEYIDVFNKKQLKWTPKKYSTILINSTIPHRVLPVNKGVRYSLIFFFHYKNKEHKSLI